MLLLLLLMTLLLFIIVFLLIALGGQSPITLSTRLLLKAGTYSLFYYKSFALNMRLLRDLLLSGKCWLAGELAPLFFIISVTF